MSKPKITVTRLNHRNLEDCDHIEWIALLYQSADVLLFQIDLRHKQREIDCWSGGKDRVEIYIGNDKVIIELPEGFDSDGSPAFASTSKYNTWVCIYSKRVYEPQLDVLWERTKKTR